MSEVKEKLIEFLRHVGDDSVSNGVVVWPECEGQGNDWNSCANHQDCGICRFEYMKRHGWLSQQLNLEI